MEAPPCIVENYRFEIFYNSLVIGHNPRAHKDVDNHAK